MKIKDKKALENIPILIFLITSIFLLINNRAVFKTSFYNEQIEAANRMQIMMDAVKKYKEELGLPIYEYDIFNTGILGEEYNETTTSLGNLESKRTSANPDMAALVIRMFHEIGLKSGDRVAVGFSGSFPGFNLAVLSAGETMDLDLIIISSMGASTYGANQKELTFPKMLAMLNRDGITRYNSVMVTPGGDDDTAKDIPDEIKEPIYSEYEDLGLDLVVESDYEKNLQDKIDLYDSYGDIDAYVAVGGNISFLGLDEGDLINRQGIIKNSSIRRENFGDRDGLISYFLSVNVPTIHFLNVKKIVTDYGMPFDPVNLTSIGDGSIYRTYTYSNVFLIIVLIVSVLALIFVNKVRKTNV